MKKQILVSIFLLISLLVGLAAHADPPGGPGPHSESAAARRNRVGTAGRPTATLTGAPTTAEGWLEAMGIPATATAPSIISRSYLISSLTTAPATDPDEQMRRANTFLHAIQDRGLDILFQQNKKTPDEITAALGVPAPMKDAFVAVLKARDMLGLELQKKVKALNGNPTTPDDKALALVYNTRLAHNRIILEQMRKNGLDEHYAFKVLSAMRDLDPTHNDDVKYAARLAAEHFTSIEGAKRQEYIDTLRQISAVPELREVFGNDAGLRRALIAAEIMKNEGKLPASMDPAPTAQDTQFVKALTGGDTALGNAYEANKARIDAYTREMAAATPTTVPASVSANPNAVAWMIGNNRVDDLKKVAPRDERGNILLTVGPNALGNPSRTQFATGDAPPMSGPAMPGSRGSVLVAVPEAQLAAAVTKINEVNDSPVPGNPNGTPRNLTRNFFTVGAAPATPAERPATRWAFHDGRFLSGTAVPDSPAIPPGVDPAAPAPFQVTDFPIGTGTAARTLRFEPLTGGTSYQLVTTTGATPTVAVGVLKPGRNLSNKIVFGVRNYDGPEGVGTYAIQPPQGSPAGPAVFTRLDVAANFDAFKRPLGTSPRTTETDFYVTKTDVPDSGAPLKRGMVMVDAEGTHEYLTDAATTEVTEGAGTPTPVTYVTRKVYKPKTDGTPGYIEGVFKHVKGDVNKASDIVWP